MEDLFNHLCFLYFPLAEALAFLKTIIFCIGSWLYVPHDLSWTGPLKNMSSWESFLCGHAGLRVYLSFSFSLEFFIITLP